MKFPRKGEVQYQQGKKDATRTRRPGAASQVIFFPSYPRRGAWRRLDTTSMKKSRENNKDSRSSYWEKKIPILVKTQVVDEYKSCVFRRIRAANGISSLANQSKDMIGSAEGESDW